MKKENRGAENICPARCDYDHAAQLLCFDPAIGEYVWLTAAEWLENRHMAWNGIVTGNLQHILIMADALNLIPRKKRRKKR